QPRGTVQPRTAGAPGTAVPRPAGTPHATSWPAATGRSHGPGAPNATEVANLTGMMRAAGAPQASVQPRRLQARRSAAPRAARLAMATTYGTTPAAPQDPAPFKPETGIVIHPAATRVIYARPGGPAVGVLPATELGSPTWVPVIQTRPGWDRILLPTRPNHSTGWIYLGG